MKYFKGLFLNTMREFMQLKSKILLLIPVIIIIISLVYIVSINKQEPRSTINKQESKSTINKQEPRSTNNNFVILMACYDIVDISTNIYKEMYYLLYNKADSANEMNMFILEPELAGSIDDNIGYIKKYMDSITISETEKEYEIFKGLSSRLNEILDDYTAKKESGYFTEAELEDIVEYYNTFSTNLIEVVKTLEQISPNEIKGIVNNNINILYLLHNIGSEMGNAAVMVYTKNFIDAYNDFALAVSKQNEYSELIKNSLDVDTSIVFDEFLQVNNSFLVNELREYIRNSYEIQSKDYNQQIDDFEYSIMDDEILLRFDELLLISYSYIDTFDAN